MWLSRRKSEHEEDINRGDDRGLYRHALRLQLLRRSATDHAYRQPGADPNSDSNSHPDSDSNADSNADPNSHSHSDANSYANADPDSDSNADSNSNADPDARSRAYSATWDERNAESCHAGGSGSLDDRSELDAHQSGTRDRTEHRQRPLYRGIGQLPTGSCRLPDGPWIGHDLDAFYRRIQYDTSSFRRLL